MYRMFDAIKNAVLSMKMMIFARGRLKMRRIVDKLRSGVFGIVVICQFVSPIKLPSTYFAVMFG